jgi:predicted dehydrogenase
VSAVLTRPRLGFAGAGRIGRRRLDSLVAAGAAEVAAVADPAVEGALETFEELLERGDLDGIVIATPSALHAEQAVAALELGLPVFCQKPLGRSAAEAARVVEAARRADVLLGLDLCYRFTAAGASVRSEAATGVLGNVVAVELVFHNAYGPDKAWFYEAELAGGGCLVDLGIHLADLALWVLDWPDWSVRSARLIGEPVERYATAELDVGGAACRLACSWQLPAGRDCVLETTFYGEQAALTFRNVGGSFYDFVAERWEGTRSATLASPPDDWGGRAIVEWARRLAAGDRFDPAAERFLESAALVDAVYAEAS